MTRSKVRHKHRKPVSRGREAAVDVVVGERGKHIGLVSIENHGRDEQGRVVGTNGIRWAVTA